MATLVVTENVTLDGVIEQVGDWFSPANAAAESADIVEALREQMSQQSALLLGRKTFESFRSYWPARTDDTTGIRAHLNQVSKYVVSGTLQHAGWEHATVLRGPMVDEVRTLKARVDGEIGITGSISLVHGLVAAALVDEYRLFVYPVVVGRGRRLFRDGTSVSLKLLHARHFRSGVVLLTYRSVASGPADRATSPSGSERLHGGPGSPT
jgi:dihydrofolate reductase